MSALRLPASKLLVQGQNLTYRVARAGFWQERLSAIPENAIAMPSNTCRNQLRGETTLQRFSGYSTIYGTKILLFRAEAPLTIKNKRSLETDV